MMLFPSARQAAALPVRYYSLNQCLKPCKNKSLFSEYLFWTASLGGVAGLNEGFWKGIEIAEKDRRKLIFTPLTSIVGAAIGAVVGIAFVPALVACVALKHFQNAYEGRRRIWERRSS